MKNLLKLFGYIWSSPLTLLGLLMSLLYRCHSYRWSQGAIECIAGRLPDGKTRIWGRPGAQTNGWLIIYAGKRERKSLRLRKHERVHVHQGLIGGVFYALAYAACFSWFFAGQGFRDWKRAYRRNPFEVAAYKE